MRVMCPVDVGNFFVVLSDQSLGNPLFASYILLHVLLINFVFVVKHTVSSARLLVSSARLLWTNPMLHSTVPQ